MPIYPTYPNDGKKPSLKTAMIFLPDDKIQCKFRPFFRQMLPPERIEEMVWGRHLAEKTECPGTVETVFFKNQSDESQPIATRSK